VLAAFAALTVLLSACQTTPRKSPPEPELRLLEAASLELPVGCTASGSFVVAFTVAPSGHTSDIRPPAAPICVQQALTAWVTSFRYAPPAHATPTSIEWLMVTGKRGT
jgi:hypothetical protein